ncbi:MAG: DUF6446 family protein, partial [Pseudomonadota bacterium]
MNGRVIAGGLVLFSVAFGAALWWFQTRGHYDEVAGLDVVEIAGAAAEVEDYRGLDGASSPLKLRGCFRVAGAVDGPPAPNAEPLIAPGWFDCFDAEAIASDLGSGAARAVLAAFNEPYGFDRVVALYPDGRAFQWRQINPCG